MLTKNMAGWMLCSMFFAYLCFTLCSQEARAIEDEALGAEKRLPQASPAETDEEILRNFGKYMMSHAPDSVKNGSNLDKARFLFGAYTEALDKKDVVNNDSMITRALVFLGNLRRFKLESDTWTCGDHTVNLENIFKGGGLPVADMARIEADSEGKVASPNSGHGALVVADGGHLYVFDAWLHAVKEGGLLRNFANGASSQWNGMPIGRWQAEVNSMDYSRFTANNGMSYEKTAADSLRQVLEKNRQAIAQDARKAQQAGAKEAIEIGVWKVKHIEPVPIPAGENNCYPGRSITLEDGVANFSQGYLPCGGAVEKPGKATTTITWEFPKTLKPGTSFKVPFSISTESDSVPLYGGGSVVFYFNGQNAVGTVDHKGRLDDPRIKIPIKKQELEVLSVPNGKQGDKLTMWVNVHGESGSGDVFYQYEMVKGE